MTKSTLSIAIITKNEAHNIRRCLESVKWADEIVIVDSGSTDNTVAICQEYTDKVFTMDWPGYGMQKNRAMSKTTQDWILVIDADESLTPALQEEIQQAIQNPHINVYSMDRHNLCWGKHMKYGDMGNNIVLRLFRRGFAKFEDNIVHEGVLTNEQVVKLKYPMLHHLSDSLEDRLDRLNRYSTLTAQMKAQRCQSASLGKAIWHGLWNFIRAYIFRRGFLDGRVGFVMAVLMAEGSYYKYIKLLFMRNIQHTESEGNDNRVEMNWDK